MSDVPSYIPAISADGVLAAGLAASIVRDVLGLGVSNTPEFAGLTLNGDLLVNGTSKLWSNPALGNYYYGVNAGNANHVAGGNIGIGGSVMANATTLNDSVGIGSEALMNAVSGVGQTAIGRMALKLGTTGTNNTAIGDSALRSSNGIGNTAIGYVAGELISTGNRNIIIGSGALSTSVSSNENIVIGASAAPALTGTPNVFIGTQACFAGNQSESVGIGHFALYQASGFGRNVAVGAYAGFGITTGIQNTFIGESAGNNALQAPNVIGSIAIGRGAYTTNSYQVVLGGPGIEDTRLYGPTRIYGTDGTGFGNLSCGNVNASSTITLFESAASLNRRCIVNANGLTVRGGAYIGFGSSSTDAGGAPAATLSQSSGTIITSGGLTVTGNVNASGHVDASSFRQAGNTTQALIPSGGIWFLDCTGGFVMRDTGSAYVTRFQVDGSGNVITSGNIQSSNVNMIFKSAGVGGASGSWGFLDANNSIRASIDCVTGQFQSDLGIGGRTTSRQAIAGAVGLDLIRGDVLRSRNANFGSVELGLTAQQNGWEINNGTPGALRDLSLRNISASGTILPTVNNSQHIGSTSLYFNRVHTNQIISSSMLFLNVNGTGYGGIATGAFGFWDTDTFIFRSNIGVTRATVDSAGLSVVGNVNASGTIVNQPRSVVSLTNNGQLEVEATSNTQLTFRFRGSDGVTRSASLTLS